eukprot:SAG11_NODE_60_length_19094_cov_26.549566_6_plen_149_part_00
MVEYLRLHGDKKFDLFVILIKWVYTPPFPSTTDFIQIHTTRIQTDSLSFPSLAKTNRLAPPPPRARGCAVWPSGGWRYQRPVDGLARGGASELHIGDEDVEGGGLTRSGEAAQDGAARPDPGGAEHRQSDRGLPHPERPAQRATPRHA